MCYTEPNKYQCRCGMRASYDPAIPRKPKDMCYICFANSLPSTLSVAVDRMTDAINREVTTGAGEIMAVEPFDEFTGPMETMP